MEPITPREFDPSRINPDEDAEPIAALSFLLELPHCLRIDDLVFLVSDRGGSWPGWNPDAIGYATGMSSPAPEDDLKPRFRVEMKQTRVDGWVPLLAAEQAFPDWKTVERPERTNGTTTSGANELRSVVQVTIYDLASDTPLGQSETDTEHFEHEVAEWMSRRLDETLSFLNQYLVILGGMRDEWHISSLSRIDLPRDTPWKLTILPTPAGRTGSSGTFDVHATLRDDLPEQRTEQEVISAVDVVHAARAGTAPFFQFVELYQASEHHLGSGRHDQSVIAACTATEVFINTLFRALWVSLERDPNKLSGVLKAPFRNQLTELLPKFLVESLDLDDKASPPGRWYTDCYLLRNRVVHEGQKASAGEAYESKVATGDFVRWIGKSLSPDPRTDWISAVSQFQRQP
jgi:hypothetical protein